MGRQPRQNTGQGLLIQTGSRAIVTLRYLGWHQVFPRPQLFFEDVIRVLWEEESHLLMSRSGTLQRLTIGLPVDLEVLLPNDDQHRNVHLPEQGSCIGRPELTAKGQIGWSFQTPQQHLNTLRQRRIWDDGLFCQKACDGSIVKRQQCISIWYASCLRGQLGSPNSANSPPRRAGEHESRERNLRVVQLVVQGMKGSLAVGKREDPARTHVLMARHDAYCSGELINKALHAHLADQQRYVLASMRAGTTLVVAQ